MSVRDLRWDVTKAKGDEAEALVKKLRTAVLNGAWEVKRDDGVRKWGNFYFEQESLNANGWEPSGLAATKAPMWIHVFDFGFLGLPTWALRRMVEQHGVPRELREGRNPTKGLVLPRRMVIDHYMELLARVEREAGEAAQRSAA